MYNIGNYYGSLEIKEDDGKYFWGIENHNGIYYEEIPKYLYDSLKKFRDTVKIEDLHSLSEILVRPKGHINYTLMDVTKTVDGNFTISNYGTNFTKHEYLYPINCQDDLDNLDVLRVVNYEN